ncbi:MAG: hypothetical protein ACK2T4_09455 [Candidatus Promineifilaceae bacterium]
MMKTILRILIYAMLIMLLSSVVVWIIGLTLGWKTSTKFSDGFFWAGVIMITIGFVSFKGYSNRTMNGPAVNLDSDDNAELWEADALRGKMILIVLGISGLLLFGLSIFISKLF